MAPDTLSLGRHESVRLVAADARIVRLGVGLRGLGMARGARRAGLLRGLVSMVAVHAALRVRVAAVLRRPLVVAAGAGRADDGHVRGTTFELVALRAVDL